MKLPKLFPFKRSPKGPKPERASRQPDGLSHARQQVMGQLQARRGGAEPPPPEPPSIPSPVAASQSQPQPGEQIAPAAPSQGMEDVLAAAASAQEAPPLDPDLLDIFREAKNEVGDSSFADGLEDVSIDELLSDLAGISHRLGVPASGRNRPPATVEPPLAPAEEATAPEVAPPDADDDQGDHDEDDGASAAGPGPGDPLNEAPPASPAPPAEEPSPQTSPPAAPTPDASSGGASDGAPTQTSEAGPGRRMILHVLFFGLALATAAGLGIRSAQGGSALVGNASAPPIALAYLKPPVVPDTVSPVSVESAAPDAAATPTPSPTPGPTATPAARAVREPAYFIYTVQSGDSLTSIAEAFDLCPDHLLWNNPGRDENDRLLVGDKFLIPGARGIVYRVEPGETLSEIAARYSISVPDIISYPANRLISADEIRAGMMILLPNGLPPSALMQDANARDAYSNPSWAGYIWPFYGPITTYYGEQRPGYVHLAIDIGGLGHYGAPVVAAASGQVATVGHEDAGLGNYVIVTHDSGSRTVYGHMSEIFVQQGEHVEQAQPIGALGCTGHSTGTHLHFELWIDGSPVDPLEYLP